jgi:hypothetical protein
MLEGKGMDAEERPHKPKKPRRPRADGGQESEDTEFETDEEEAPRVRVKKPKKKREKVPGQPEESEDTEFEDEEPSADGSRRAKRRSSLISPVSFPGQHGAQNALEVDGCVAVHLKLTGISVSSRECHL